MDLYVKRKNNLLGVNKKKIIFLTLEFLPGQEKDTKDISHKRKCW